MTSQGWLEHHCSSIWQGVERVHFDFKQKADRRTSVLADTDKKNLSKATSGFANSGGGVLIWGVDDDGGAKPIADAKTFLNTLLQLSFQVTEPSVIGIDGAVIQADSSAGDGFVLLYIPESDSGPHRAVLSITEVNGHYFVRSGSSFTKASHVQLEDMFGRRPKPKLKCILELGCRVYDANYDIWALVQIINEGRGLARYPYIELSVNKPYYVSAYGYDGNGRTGLPMLNATDHILYPGTGMDKGFRYVEYGSQGNLAIHSGAALKLTQIKCDQIAASELIELKIDCRWAAEGVPVSLETRIISVDEFLSRAI
jgi:hypothetical protein